MSTGTAQNWRVDFGISDRTAPSFFGSIADVEATYATAPQPHSLRRAFESLGISGVLCQDDVPVIYFREVATVDPRDAEAVRRSFWGQGVAPILVLIAPDEVHIYSGFVEPQITPPRDSPPEGFIERLNRVSDELQRFLISVESGEYFRIHYRSFDPRQRVDRNLLRDLQAIRESLSDHDCPSISPEVLDSFLCRLVFTCYLFDRDIVDTKYLRDIGIEGASHLRDILGRSSYAQAKEELYSLFVQLGKDFNGDLFSDDLASERDLIEEPHFKRISSFFQGIDPRTGQKSFWPYDFSIIPIETISAIYEHFIKVASEKKKKDAGAFYTPRFLAEYVLDLALADPPALLNRTFLDPACGSGIFLVGLFNRLAQEWNHRHPDATYGQRLNALTHILKSNLFGFDIHRTACLIAAFSLYLALLDQLSPPDIRRVLRKVKVLPHLWEITHPNRPQSGMLISSLRSLRHRRKWTM